MHAGRYAMKTKLVFDGLAAQLSRHEKKFCVSALKKGGRMREGILVGCIAQQVSGKLVWDAATQSFSGNAAANALVKPYIRKGWEF